MFLPSILRILLCTTPTDMRKSIDGLSTLVQDVLRENPACGTVFVFCNRGRDKLKLLYWDKNGFCVLYKRLEKGRFSFPSHATEVSLQAAELRDLLSGLPFLKRPPREVKAPRFYTTHCGFL